MIEIISNDKWCRDKCDPALENLAYVYKMHAFILFQLFHFLRELCACSVNYIKFLIVGYSSGKCFIVKYV